MHTLSPLIENYLKQSKPLLSGLKTQSIQEMRDQFNERQRSFNKNIPNYDLSILNQTIDTSQGTIPIRVYALHHENVSPLVIFFHGGGFVFGNLDSLESFCREIAFFARCTVISVDYPLAPEHPFPEAPETAYAATLWIYIPK